MLLHRLLYRYTVGYCLQDTALAIRYCSLAVSPRARYLVLFTMYRDFSLQIAGVATTTVVFDNLSEVLPRFWGTLLA